VPGGNTDGAVRIGGVVHKPSSPWTLTVRASLRSGDFPVVTGAGILIGQIDLRTRGGQSGVTPSMVSGWELSPSCDQPGAP